MTILDLTVPQFQILIGAFDITGAVDSFTVAHPLAERGTPLNWSGSIELSYLINLAEFEESFDDWLNPGRWAAGAYPVDFYIEGFLFQTLRIARNGYTYEEDPENGSALAQIQLTDLLELLDSYSPPQDAPELTVGASVRWEDGVKALVEAAIAQVNAERSRRGQAPITVAIAINYTDNPDVFTAPKTVSGSLVKTAQEWAGERGYWLWCDNEVIRLAPYPQTGAPIYQFSRKQVDPFARVQGLDEPLNKLVVTCANQKADTCAAVYPRIRPEYGAKLDGSLYIRRRVIEDRQRLGNQVTETIEEQAAIIFAYPPGYTFSGDPYATITSSITRKTTTLSTAENKILKVEEDVDRAIGCFEDFRDSFPVASWSALMPSCQKVVTTYNTDSQGQLTSIETDEYAPAFVLYTINGSNPFVQQVEATLRYKTVQRWEQECGDNYNKITTRYTAPIATGNTPNGLVFDSETVEPNSSPPEQPYWEAEFPLTTELLTGQAEFDHAGFSAYVPNQNEIQANSLVDNAGCDRLARLEGNLRWQRYYAREIAHGYHPSLLTYQPFQIAHVHTGAVVRDGLTVSMGDSPIGDRKQFVISYRGNLLGIIPPVPEVPGAAAIPASLISQIYEASSTVEQFGDWLIIGGPNSYTFESEVEQFGDWRIEVEIIAPDSTVEQFGDWQIDRLFTLPSTVESFGDWVLTVYPPIVWGDSTVEALGDWSVQVETLVAPASIVEQFGDWSVTIEDDDDMNRILQKDSTWQHVSNFSGVQQGIMWNSAGGGDSATGTFKIGYITLQNTLYCYLAGGGSTNGNLKVINFRRKTDDTTVLTVNMATALGVDTDPMVPRSIDTSSAAGETVYLECIDSDTNGTWGWFGICPLVFAQ